LVFDGQSPSYDSSKRLTIYPSKLNTINWKTIIFTSLLLTLSFQACCFGLTGHRVIVDIAEQPLSLNAKRMINQILVNGEAHKKTSLNHQAGLNKLNN
jgi:hypothetical protein